MANINLEVSVEEAQGILIALSKLPYEQVAGLIEKVKSQAESQLKKEEVAG